MAGFNLVNRFWDWGGERVLAVNVLGLWWFEGWC